MSERVVKDQLHPINLGDTRILVSPAHDSLHYFEPLDASWIRYMNEHGQQQMVVINERGANMIIEHTDLPCVWRETITQREHDSLVVALGQMVTDEMFDLDIDVDAIEEQVAAELDAEFGDDVE